MAQFEEVLDRVQEALTRSSPAEICALFQRVVKDQIISEAYGKSLGLYQLSDKMAPKPKSDLMSTQGSTSHWTLNQGQLSQVRKCDPYQTGFEFEPSVAEHDCSGPRPTIDPLYEHQGNNPKIIQELGGGPVMDKHYLNHRLSSTSIISDYQCGFRSDNRMKDLLRGAEKMQKPLGENDIIDEGNLENEKEWLEQVEEAARRIAVPLWQHWDRGRRILLPLVPGKTAGCATGENTTKNREAQCHVFNMEEETELAIACRTLDLYCDSFNCTEADLRFTLDNEGATGTAESPCFSTYDSVATTDLNQLFTYETGRKVSPDVDVCRAADRSTKDLLWSMGDGQWGMDTGFTEDITHVFSPCTLTDTHTDAQDHSFYSNTDQSMTLDIFNDAENVLKTACNTNTCMTDDTRDLHLNKEDEEVADSHCGAKMQEMEQDPFVCPFDLADDLSEILTDDFLERLVDPNLDTEGFFDDPLFNCEEELSTCSKELSTCTELPMMTEPFPDIQQQGEEDKTTGKTKSRSKRPRAPRIQQCPDQDTPSRPKRQRAAAQPKTKVVQAELSITQATGSEPSSAETAGLSTTPPRILHLHPSIQFITIPDTPSCQVVRSLRLSPSVITLPITNTAATPTYIFVPAGSPQFKPQVPPLSPTNGEVAPVQMSSSPRGSLSDTASKALTHPCASPLSPGNEPSTCKESPLPQCPTPLDIPQDVKDYIQEAKAHMSQACQVMEAGLSLTSHYVDVPVSQREILRSGKNINKALDKEIVIMGDTDRQKSLLGRSRIFERSKGEKPKRYILLLGNAGMGKTTLIRRLCLDWSTDCIPQFDFVFLLDSKALSLTDATFSLQTLLLNLSSFAPTCKDPNAVYAQILAAPKRVLVIFDGFCELRDYEILLQTQEKDLVTSLQKDSKAQTFTVKQLYSAILQRVLLPGCTLLLSTRTRGTASQLLRRTDSLLEVCGFTPTDVQIYLSQYFTDPDLRVSALDCFKNCSYLHLLCWNPGLCRLVCLVLEQCKSLEVLPRTLTELCHQVLCMKVEKDSKDTNSQAETPSEISEKSVEETQTKSSSSSQMKRRNKNTHTQRTRGSKKQEKEKDDKDGEEMKSNGWEAVKTQERELLAQLSSQAWGGIKANSSIVPKGRTISAKLKAFGQRTGLLLSYNLGTRQVVSNCESEDRRKTGTRETGEKRGSKGRTETENADASDDQILMWANPFLQSYLAGIHLSLSRTITDRAFLQTLPFQSGQKGRRRPQREELDLTQRFAVGLLFYNRRELQRFHSYTETSFRDMLDSKQALVTTHLEGLSHDDLSPAQVLEACRYVYEASSSHGDGSRDSGSQRLVAHLAENLPEVLTFHGVPFKPSDVFAVQNVLDQGGADGRRFCLNLEDSGIQISGLRALLGLNNINTYRACIADVITLWEQLEQNGEEALLQVTVSKFKVHPLKATQVCHIEHLAKLVNIHVHKRLSDSSSQCDSILAEGVPAVKELHKLELELGPEKGPLVLPKLWELLPGLHNLQHLDLENSTIGDKGAEELADTLVSLGSLEILNLSQNCIGDQGVRKLATVLRDLPKLQCLSLYSNVICDEGAETLAAVLPHMASLTDLDVKYNKLTSVGAQSLGASLRNCRKIKTLRMWNQCIPYGVFERLQQQDNRIQWQ
nr:MHC class II transactivator isoform X2 [Pseudochaenichthys georgianus]